MAERASGEASKKGSGDILQAWKRPGARVWFITSLLTMAVATLAGGAIYVNHERARVRLEAQYSRLAAHYAEEADLRIVSYRRAASVIGSVSSWRNSALAQEALAKKVDDDVKKQTEAVKASGNAQAKRDARLAAAAVAIANTNAARAAVADVEQARDKATDDFSKKNDEFRRAVREVEASEAKLKSAQEALAASGVGRDGGAPSAAGVKAMQDLQAAKQANATALQQQRDAKAAYDAALRDSSEKLSAVVKARDAVKNFEKLEAEKSKDFNEADRATARAQAKLDDVQKQTERGKEGTVPNLVEVAEQARLSFLPARGACDEKSNDARLCYATAVARNLFSGPVRSRPDVVACAEGARTSSVRDGVVLLAGRDILFPIDEAESESKSESKDKKPEVGKSGAPPTAEKKEDPGPPKPLCLRVPISELVAFPRGGEATEAGDSPSGELLLVDGTTCRVLESSDTDSQVRPVSIPGCAAAMLPKAEPLSQGAEKKEKPKEAGGKGEHDTEQVAGLEIGREKYVAFWQALKSPFRCAEGTNTSEPTESKICGASQSLVVVDLVRTDRLIDQIRGLSPLTFLALVVLAALAVFSWPVAKLWLIGASARFSRFDSAFLGTSALALTFIVTLSCLALVARARLTQRVDDQLDAVATELTLRLDAAMKNAKENLKRFEDATGELRKRIVKAGPSSPRNFSVPDDVHDACLNFRKGSHDLPWPHPEDRSVVWTLCEAKADRRLTVGNGPNSSLNFWTNSQGYVQIQENDGASGVPPVNVSGREYFRRARGECETKPATPPDENADTYVAEVVRSLTSTKKVLVVAQGLCDTSPDNRNTSSVAGFETDIYRFEQLDMPSGFQWAVVDRTGKVMLHSSMDAQHLHDLRDDMDDSTGAVLQSATFSGALARFDGEYRGIRSRFRVSPSKDVPEWTVVAIGSRGQNEVISRDTLVTTAAAYGLFVLGMALVAVGFALVRITKSKKTAEHADAALFDPRPRGDAARTYAGISARLFGGSSILWISTLACPWIPAWAILAPLCALLIWSARKVPGIWTEEPPREVKTRLTPGRRLLEWVGSWGMWDRLHVTYALCCFSFAVAFVVVPTTACFVGSFSLSAQSSLRTEQRAVAERSGCKEAPSASCWKPVIGLEPHRSGPVAMDLLQHDVPEVPERYSLFLRPGLQWPLEWLMSWFHSDYLPRPNGASELRYERGNVLQGLHIASKDHHGKRLDSTVPRLFRHTKWPHLLFGAGCVVLLLLAAHALAYLSLKRLFFMDMLVERAESRKNTTATGAPTKRVLFLFPPKDVLAETAESETTVILRENDSWEYPHFKITQVEKAHLVLAEVDPLRRGPSELRSRWVEALKDFDVVRGPGRGPLELAEENRAAYMHQWSISDVNEQRVLAQLAVDGHVSPHPANASVLRHLAARGLLDDNTLSIADHDFARYLEHSVKPEQMQAWQAGETEVAWDVIRLPLVTCVALVLWLVYVSHPELAESGALLLPPAAGGLPAVLRLVASLAKKGGGVEMTA